MVVYYFSAPWCGPCATYGPLLSRVAADYPMLDLHKINIDDEMMLAYQFKVDSIPALALKDNPNFPKLVGAASEADLRQWLTHALAENMKVVH